VKGRFSKAAPLVRDICTAIEEWAPRGLAFEGDRIGLSIGDPDWEASRVLVALTITPEVAQTAIRKKANLIVSHHPVIWDPLSALRTDVPHTRMCIELAAARVACFAAHTNLDVAPGGVNDTLATLLDLVNCKPLFPLPHSGMVKLVTFVPETHLSDVRKAVCDAGAGVVGEYTHCTFSAAGVGTFRPSEEASPYSGERHRLNEEPERRFEVLVPKGRIPSVVNALLQAHPYEEVAYDLVQLENKDTSVGLGVRGKLRKPMSMRALAQHVRAALGLSSVRCVGDLQKQVRTVAVLGGGGGSKVREIPADIDAFVTGDVGYHDALAAQEQGLAVIDAGHAGTENCIVPVLARFLKKRFRSLRVLTYAEREVFRLAAK
jgi:dinuclear metal center YbgI/SA1388 family protein